MENFKDKIRVVRNIISRSFLCSIFSAMILSLITIIATENFHFIAFIVFGFYYFIFYVLFAIPIQLKLNQTPKKYNIIYLLIYLFGALVASALAIIVMVGGNPFITIGYYFTAIFGSVVFWFFDSMFLQKIRTNFSVLI